MPGPLAGPGMCAVCAGDVHRARHPGRSNIETIWGTTLGEHDIDVDPALLKKGSDAAEDVLVALNKDGRLADDTTNAAASALSQENFQLGKSLKITGDLWYSQVTTLVQACHKIQQNLVANAEDHKMTETAGEMRMSEISKAFE